MEEIKHKIRWLNFRAVGYWNTHIFTPDWIADKLLNKKPDEKIEKEEFAIGFDLRDKSVKYDFRNIHFLTTENDVVFRIEENEINDETITLVTQLSRRLICSLPHTPIKGMGFNFGYKFNIRDEDNEFVNWFKAISNPPNEFNLSQININKKIDSFLMTIVLILKGEELRVTINYQGEDGFDIAKINDDLIFNLIKSSENILSNGSN
jgi:hypothetical protein